MLGKTIADKGKSTLVTAQLAELSPELVERGVVFVQRSDTGRVLGRIKPDKSAFVFMGGKSEQIVLCLEGRIISRKISISGETQMAFEKQFSMPRLELEVLKIIMKAG